MIKAVMILLLLCVPGLSIADANNDEVTLQILNSQIEKLTMERDKKYEELKQCEKTTKGFKIAGITTLVATGFGIYGNIKLAQKLKGDTGSRKKDSVSEDTCAKDPICSWERQCEMTNYKVKNCDHDKDCCAADGCPCEK